MIVFELICPKHHRFEGWFASAGDFDGQKRRGLLCCPVCAHSGIEKLPTAKIGKSEARPPQVNRVSQPEVELDQEPAPTLPAGIDPAKLNELLDYVLAHTENVGGEFPAEARRIHYHEAPLRSIRGTASREEAEKLLDEGIQVATLPIPPRGDWH